MQLLLKLIFYVSYIDYVRNLLKCIILKFINKEYTKLEHGRTSLAVYLQHKSSPHGKGEIMNISQGI